jgi:hypothetical protein
MSYNSSEISPTHPIFGTGYRKLADNETLMPGDQTACLSCLLSPTGTPGWVNADWADGKTTVLESLENDADALDRVYRRPL